MAAELESLSQRDRNGEVLSKKEEKRFKKLNALYLERAENAQRVFEAEQRVAAFQPPKPVEPEPPENTSSTNQTDSSDNRNSTQTAEKDCNEKCDDKIERIEARHKARSRVESKPEPEATQEEKEAALFADKEEELHRQRIEQAKELKRLAEGPIADYRKALDKIREIEQNDEAKKEAGGEQNIRSAKLNALRELASATEDYGLVLQELDALLDAEEITVEQYGQAFDDVIQSISDTDKALELLASRVQDEDVIKSPVKKDAIDDANQSLKTSEEYLEAINERKREALELEAQEIENKLLLAELGEGEPVDIKALRERLAIIRENLDLLQRGFTSGQAAEIAPKLVQSAEYNELKDDVKDIFKGGIKAAIDGDFEDFLADKLQSAADSMFDNAIDTLLDALLAEGGPLESLIGSIFGGGDGDPFSNLFGNLFGGSKTSATGEATDALGKFSNGLTAAEGGLGQFGGALGSIFGLGAGITGALGGNSQIGGLLGVLPGLFAGFFAEGGVVPRGQFAIVGEQGPEIITAGASPIRVTPFNDNIAPSNVTRLTPDGGGGKSMTYAPINNFYGHTQDDLRRSLDERDRALKAEMPGMMDRHSFNRNRGMG